MKAGSLEERILARMKERFEYWRHQWFMVYQGQNEDTLLRYFQSAYMDGYEDALKEGVPA